jgi:predicted transcriptional regulator
MSDDELFQQILPEVQKIFRSGIVLRASLALHEKPGTLTGIAEEIGSVPVALVPKIQMLERKGFVEEKDGVWRLMNSRRILIPNILELLMTADVENRENTGVLLDSSGIPFFRREIWHFFNH